MTGRVRRALAAVTAALLLVTACGSDGSGAGGHLPDLELPPLGDAEPIELAALDGPTVVNLWATWCAPCRRELPDFEQVSVERADEVRFVGVNIGDRESQATEFLADLGITFDNYLDLDGALHTALGVATLPITVVTGQDGAVRLVHAGPMDADELNAEIDRALRAMD